MHKFSKRATLLVSLGLMAIPLGAAAVTAYACTAVATLSDSPGAALPGSTVTVTGNFFGTHNAADATSAGPVELRLGSLTGPVLATASPSGTARSFSVQVAIPANAVPGDTFIAATQQTATGTPVYGTPARQAFTVSAPPAAPPPLFAPVSFTPPAAACVVPSVKGMTTSAAERKILASHCTVGTVSKPRKPHSKKHHTYKLVVAGTDLSAGITSANGTKVDLLLRWK
jgi:hypothetical protein